MVRRPGSRALRATIIRKFWKSRLEAHKVEIHVADKVVYREDIYVGPSEHRIVRVLSGLSQ